MSSIALKRLGKELMIIKEKGTPAGEPLLLPVVLRPAHGTCSLTSALCPTHSGINLLQADDLQTWYFTIEVLGESVYAVSRSVECKLHEEEDGPQS